MLLISSKALTDFCLVYPTFLARGMPPDPLVEACYTQAECTSYTSHPTMFPYYSALTTCPPPSLTRHYMKMLLLEQNAKINLAVVTLQ